MVVSQSCCNARRSFEGSTRVYGVPAGAKLFRKKFEQKLKGAPARGMCEVWRAKRVIRFYW